MVQLQKMSALSMSLPWASKLACWLVPGGVSVPQLVLYCIVLSLGCLGYGLLSWLGSMVQAIKSDEGAEEEIRVLLCTAGAQRAGLGLTKQLQAATTDLT